jgi:hypothetical protein
MTRLYRFTGALTLLLTLLCTGVRAQTTVAVMDFDGATPEMTVVTTQVFFDNGADGFFGIHDADNDNTDGAPADTGDGNASDVAQITLADIVDDFLFVNDLARENDMEPGTTVGEAAIVTFGPVTVTGLTGLLFSFDYDVVGFESSDLAVYELFIDGVGQGTVDLLNGATGPRTFSGSADVIIPDNSGSVYLELRITQNGDSDQAGFDNFIVTSGNTGLPCGVTSFGANQAETCTAFTNGVADEYTISFDYAGIDASAVLGLMVDGTPASGFTNSGDDPTADNGGTITISSPDLLEGTSYEVTLTGGNCAYSVTGNVAANSCVSVCDLSISIPDDLTIICNGFTSADNADAVTIEIDYDGVEPGVIITAPGLTIGGDDPAVDEDGTIVISGLVEGGSYVISVNGGACTGGDAITVPVVVPGNLCTPGELVINEVLADPGSVNDANNDGVFSGSDDEFIELYNPTLNTLDLGGYTISEGAGVRYTFPAGYMLPARTGFVLFGGGVPNVPCPNDVASTTFIGLNNGGDIVVVRDENGLTVAQMSYGAEGGDDQSLALNPNGDPASGYVQHTTITNPNGAPVRSSACFFNDNPSIVLPLEMLSFGASVTGKQVVLAWSTINEIDNDRFVVERSTDSRRWIQIGTVMATGESSGAYAFSDESPLDGENYYRLRQFDADDASAVYGPVMVVFSATEFRAYPNPAGNEIYFGGDYAPSNRVSLLDANGRVLRELPAGTDRADLTGMPAGIYLLRVAGPSGTDVVRFVKR